MRQNFNIDRLVDYSMESIPETTKVINPEYRRLDGIVCRLAAKHSRELAKFAAIYLEGAIEVHEVEAYQQKKTFLLEGIQSMELELMTAKQQRKDVQCHIELSQLPEEERFKRLATPRKHLLDPIKMIAYRAETAMANILGHPMKKSDERRSLRRSIYQTEADLIPDEKMGL